MFSLANHILKLWLFLSVLFYSTNGFRDSSGEKKMNLRIGFDLTQGENGAPSLRIRDFEESSEFNPRAVEEDAANDKKSSPSVRADSFSDSSEMVTNNAAKDRYESSKERDRSNDKSDDDDSNDSDRRISTRGLVPGEYEPEENARIHPKFQESSESDSERPRRRHKRSISLKGLMANLRNKKSGSVIQDGRENSST